MQKKQEVKKLCETFMKDLLNIRAKKDISTYKLSDITGILQPNLMRFENVSYNPSLETLIKVVDAMDMKLTVVDK